MDEFEKGTKSSPFLALNAGFALFHNNIDMIFALDDSC
jgi:hypothetical protein